MNEHGVYVNKLATGNHLLVCLYVDDLLVTGSIQAEIDEFKRVMKSEQGYVLEPEKTC